MVNKRKNPRLDYGIAVFQNGIQSITKDISCNGAFINMEEQLLLTKIGTEISFSLDFPDAKKHIDIKGVIVHHGKNDDGMGIWFKKMEERSKSFIRNFVLNRI
jgi:hypothetical protein